MTTKDTISHDSIPPDILNIYIYRTICFASYIWWNSHAFRYYFAVQIVTDMCGVGLHVTRHVQNPFWLGLIIHKSFLIRCWIIYELLFLSLSLSLLPRSSTIAPCPFFFILFCGVQKEERIQLSVLARSFARWHSINLLNNWTTRQRPGLLEQHWMLGNAVPIVRIILILKEVIP